MLRGTGSTPPPDATERALGILDRLLTPVDRPMLYLVPALLAYLPMLALRIVLVTHPLSANLTLALSAFLPTIAFMIATGSAAQVLTHRRARREVTLGSLLGSLQWPTLLGTGVVGGLMIAVGSFLLFVPALVFGAWLAFAGCVAQMEVVGPMEAINRGRTMVGGGRWIALLYLAVPAALARFLLDMIPSAFFHLTMGLSHEAGLVKLSMLFLWSALVDVVLLAFVSGALADMYLDKD